MKNEHLKSKRVKRGRPKTSDRGKLLSTREEDILIELKAGKTYSQIAETHFISMDTVKTHAKNIYKKLEVNNRTQAVNKFFDHNQGK